MKMFAINFGDLRNGNLQIGTVKIGNVQIGKFKIENIQIGNEENFNLNGTCGPPYIS